MLHNLFLPLIALVSGIASLFIDPKSQPKRAWILVGLLIASVAGTTAAGVQDDDDQAKDKADLRSQITDVKKTADADKDEILKAFNDGLFRSATGATPDAAQFKQITAADVARTQLQSTGLGAQASRPTIEYFSKDLDSELVTKALNEGGLIFDKEPGNVATIPTNAMWVGDSVNLADLKFVALTLVRAGVQLRAIRHFCDGGQPGGKKSNYIEIGADKNIHYPPLTVDQIQALANIPSRQACR